MADVLPPAPVIVFGYNRPDHLRQTLSALAAADGARGSPLWLFCDGAKPGADMARIDAVRAVANDPVWDTHFASVTRIMADQNRGLAASIIGGVSRVLERAQTAIVIEDDLIVAPDFLQFMNDCLTFYQDDPKVGSITGFCPLSTLPAGYSADVMAVPRNCSHGWATWRDRWEQVDWDAPGAARIRDDAALRRKFNAAGSDRAYRLRRQLEGRIDSWSIRFGLWQFLDGRHTIYPSQNRIRNIGFDGSGVHTRAGQEINHEIAAKPYTLEKVSENNDILDAFHQVYSGSPARRAVRWLRAGLQGISPR